MCKNKLGVAVAAALLGACATDAFAQAQTTPVKPRYEFPGSEGPVGAVRLPDTNIYAAPFVTFAAGYDDNIFATENNEKGSAIYVLSPGIALNARDATKVFQLSYQAAIGRYWSSDNDDYVDQTTRASFDMALTRSFAMRLSYDYIYGHDPRGSNDRAVSERPDRYLNKTPGVILAYGAQGAPGRVEVYYSNAHKRYHNNRDVTFAADRNTEEVGGAFYWRVMPRTHLIAEARETRLGYIDPTSPFSGNEKRYYGGVTWEATALTSGTFKIGQVKKQFQLDTYEGFEGTAWEGLISWSPRTYSRFDFFTSRQPVESTGLGSFILSEVYGAAWTHTWSSVVTTGVNVRFQKDEYQGFPRNDDFWSLGANVAYKFRRWLTLGAAYTYSQRDSNNVGLDYDRNLFLLTASFTM